MDGPAVVALDGGWGVNGQWGTGKTAFTGTGTLVGILWGGSGNPL